MFIMEDNQVEEVVEVIQEESNVEKQGLISKINFYLKKLKLFYTECLRVWKITRRPDKEEFKTIVKISGLGILLIGVIGFLVHFVKETLF